MIGHNLAPSLGAILRSRTLSRSGISTARSSGGKPEPVNMGEYEDDHMIAPGGGEAVAGICHARGPNASLPPQWRICVTVENVDESINLRVE